MRNVQAGPTGAENPDEADLEPEDGLVRVEVEPLLRGGGPDVAGVGDEDPQTPRPTSAVAARSFFASVMPGWMVSRSTTMHAMIPSRDALWP